MTRFETCLRIAGDFVMRGEIERAREWATTAALRRDGELTEDERTMWLESMRRAT